MRQRNERRSGGRALSASGREQRVLVVDDEPDIRELLELTLAKMGLGVDSAGSIAEAKERLRATKYQLCLTDMRLSDGEGLANCITGLKRLAPIAERHGVTLCLELLNSKIDHHDYQCDHSAWGAEVIKGVGSARVRLLFDIYHMQIMEGDVVRNIKTHAPYIAHFHTGGVPGRNEIDETQELNYRLVAQTIAGLGFGGFLAHEFEPIRDPLSSLKQAYEICNV